MPKIEWTSLPEAIRKHLLLRLKERKTSAMSNVWDGRQAPRDTDPVPGADR